MSSLVSDQKAFAHPDRTVSIYDKARSAAVHGEEIPEVDARFVNAIAWDVRRAVNEFLTFADREGLTKRKDVRLALEDSSAATKIESWIRDYAWSQGWAKHLDENRGE